MAGVSINPRVTRILSISLLVLHFTIVIIIWLNASHSLLLGGAAAATVAFGQLFGLLAASCALLQFMLMGRAAWIEQAFGLENLAKLHRLNGYATITCITIHPVLLTVGYAILGHTGFVAQFLSFVTDYEDVWKALIAALLFASVVFASVYIVRKHLRYEVWHWVHIMVYGAIILAFGHQVHVGGSFVGRPALIIYWYGLYAFAGLNVLIWRFLLPLYNAWRFNFAISRVERETHDTVSVYISGRGLERFRARPGQFVFIWILRKPYLFEEHPFSLSALPAGNVMRVTIKNVGDYTAKIQGLTAGARVVVSGPYGRFTPPNSERTRLYLAGGVGITPIRTMLEAQNPATDSILIYGNKTQSDTIFERELAALTRTRKLKIHHVYSAEPTHKGETGHVDLSLIERLVPDFREREVFLCGPPAMMATLTATLKQAGLPSHRLHFERSALHPVS